MIDKSRTIDLLVVDNDTMYSPVLLGRDALRQFGLRMIEGSTGYEEAVGEVLNIDVEGMSEEKEMKINPEVESKHHDRLRKLYELEYIKSNVKGVQSFLGLASYFRKYIEGFSTIAKPSYDLTKTRVKFKYGESEFESFERLKNKLVKASILAIYDPDGETELHCDASALGFGAVLMQKKGLELSSSFLFFEKKV
ncbi:uncharacterized protein LOC127284304 [Leptopilina boulardi]|uniref:uncharacterized protein LOC127284304 n=1 Tax=Leptopilina boulardi TaxID=63433 RepID=UPI0021F59FF3|nr:uncharacterized protein LOC127284304 [Leptopilina boulardi]